MKVYSPDFFKDFHCVGSDCLDNCCKMNWEIQIDQATYERYKALDSGLCRHISSDGDKHYILQENGQCPFLNEKGLCSILLKYGDRSISEICAQHPRFFQWFGAYKEAGTGLCCEESARLWLTRGAKADFCLTETDEPDDELEFDGELLNAVLAARQVLIGLLQNEQFTLSQKLKAMLIFGLNTVTFEADQVIQGYYELAQAFADHEYVCELLAQLGEDPGFEGMLSACEQVIGYFKELDYMDSVLPDALQDIQGRLGEIINSANAFDRELPQVNEQLCAVAVYNVFRYFIRCARGEEALPQLEICILNVCILRLWDISLWLDGKFSFDTQLCAVKEFSKEIEYSDSLDLIYQDVFTDSRLSAQNLVCLAQV